MASILTRIERYFEFKTPVVWKNVFIFAFGYSIFFYGFYLLPTLKVTSFLWAFLFGLIGDTAVSAGAHKLWTHKTYKAELPMRIIIMLCYHMAGLYSIVTWSRDHRTHHKFTDTDADPHNSSRGFFYSHCGWLMLKRHPEFKEKVKTIDVSDLWQDPVIRFHQKHFVILTVLIHMVLPSAFLHYVGGESFKNSIIFGLFWRYLFSLNLLWCVNSVAHYWGDKPYNKNIRATDNALVAFATIGEGWHNFHHTFPWDYRIGERGQGYHFSAYVIEWFAKFGLAYDLKTASPELIQKIVNNQNLPKNYEAPEPGYTQRNIIATDDIKAP